ncbi:MAG: glycosyltransferase family 2 protein [Solirubrobacteraceae bacterium]
MTGEPHEKRVPGVPRVSVVIPTLNEERNISPVLARLPDSIFELIVIDGRSTDDTVEEVRRLRPDARLLTQTGTGKGEALCTGFRAARGEIIVMLDADGSTDPAEIPEFVEVLLGGADVAKGSRFIRGGGSSDITATRRLGNWILSRLVNRLYGTAYSDLCYGYNAFWANCLPVLDIACEGFEVEALINVQIAKAKLRVIEVPSHESARLHGESNLRPIPDGLRILRIILSQRFIARTQACRDADAARTASLAIQMPRLGRPGRHRT